jgi:hypothetical protein
LDWLRLKLADNLTSPVGWLRNQLLHTVDRDHPFQSTAHGLDSHETLLSVYGGKRKTFRGD